MKIIKLFWRQLWMGVSMLSIVGVVCGVLILFYQGLNHVLAQLPPDWEMYGRYAVAFLLVSWVLGLIVWALEDSHSPSRLRRG